jgi:hypothetical protein
MNFIDADIAFSGKQFSNAELQSLKELYLD